jgi:hypothetical protein
MTVQTRTKSTPAAGPPSGVNQFTIFEGMTFPITGRSNPVGIMYTPTASKNGASAKASTPRAIAAANPIAIDFKNMFK